MRPVPAPERSRRLPTPGPPWLIAAAVLLTLAGALFAAFALTASLAHAGDTPCPDGQPSVGDIGITELTGLARFSMSGDVSTGLQRFAAFRREPEVTSVDGGGNGTALRAGDVIVAVDGALITTREGGRRLANLEPGRSVLLAIRRDGRRMDLRLVPTVRCGPVPAWVSLPDTPAVPTAPVAPTPPGAPTPPRAPRAWTVAPRVMVIPRTADTPEDVETPEPEQEAERALASARAMASLGNRGWFGIGIDCEDCHWAALPGDSGLTWVSGEAPTIYRVDEGSPAERAGLQRGDVLTHIDGVSLLTPEGGRLFGAVKPGQHVRLTYRRDGRLATATAVAEARPGVLGAYSKTLDEMRGQLKRLAQSDPGDQQMRRQVEQMQRDMQQRERTLMIQRQQLNTMQRLRWTGSVGDADVEVKGLGNVTVTTDDATGAIVVTTSDATIHIRPSDAAPAPPAHGHKTPKPSKAPRTSPD